MHSMSQVLTKLLPISAGPVLGELRRCQLKKQCNAEVPRESGHRIERNYNVETI